MVSNQTLNYFSYNAPVGDGNGNHFPGFNPPDGYDTDHQAFSGITTDQSRDGLSTAFYTVDPIA